MSVGLAIIAKNEEKRLPNLLKSIEGAFDQVVLVDTGSIDRTKYVFSEWAAEERKRNPDFKWEMRFFRWVKDFGAARAFAQSLLTTDWEVWADCDDVINGARNIRQLVAQAQENIAGFVAGYNYAQHPQTGQPVCYLKRERIVRAGKGHWINRVHEAQVVEGPIIYVGPEVVEWVHQKQYATVEEMQAFDARRNLDILEKWDEDEPNNPRTLAYLGTENAAAGKIDEAIPFFEQYFRLDPEWDEERAQVHRKLAMCMLLKQRPNDAMGLAFEAIKLLPRWTDSYNTLAEVYFTLGDFNKSIFWAQEALAKGAPDTMLIINPLDYTFQPRKILAGAYAGLHQWDEAVKFGSEAWQLNPADEGLGQIVQHWRSMAKRDHCANTVALLAQTLVAHDEQLKALTFLNECVPWFAEDHPGVVNLRSELRERLDWIKDPRTLLTHYAEGGSKPEDFLPDDQRDKVAAALPRTQFLYAGIHEQMLEKHREGLIESAWWQADAMLEAVANASASD